MELCHAVLITTFPSPELNHWTLANGVHCVAAEMPDATLTCLDLWCRAGSASEETGEEGMAHFLEHMVFKGSERMEAGAFGRPSKLSGAAAMPQRASTMFISACSFHRSRLLQQNCCLTWC